MNFVIKILVTTFAVVITSYILPGVSVDLFTTAILVALVISILNSLLKPILIILTIPITVFSFGLFLLVINAFIIMLTSRIVNGFKVDGFWWALAFSVILSIVTGILDSLNKKDENGYYK